MSRAGRASRPNSDDRRRRIERSAAASGDLGDQARLLVERVRAGELPALHLQAAAALRHPAARIALGDSAPAPLTFDYSQELRAIAGMAGPCVALAWAADSLERALPWVDNDPVVANAISAARTVAASGRRFPERKADRIHRATDAAYENAPPSSVAKAVFDGANALAVGVTWFDPSRQRLPQTSSHMATQAHGAVVDMCNAAFRAAEPLPAGWEPASKTPARVQAHDDEKLWAMQRLAEYLLGERFVRCKLPGDGGAEWTEIVRKEAEENERITRLIDEAVRAKAARKERNSRRNSRRNPDERLRALERAWRADVSDWAAADALMAELDRVGRSEETEGVARLSSPEVVTLDMAILNSIWRSGEVMSSRDPAAWARRGPIGRRQIAEMILSAAAGSVVAPIATLEPLQPAPRPCFDPRHDEPCQYDGCAACPDECEAPNLPVYTGKIAAAFVLADDDFMAIGVRAVPIEASAQGREVRVVFGDWIGQGPASVTSQVMRRAHTLDDYRREVVDTDDVRVYDNGGETADRFTIVMSHTPRNALGRVDESEEPQYVTVAANSQPTHPSYGFWQHVEASFNLDDPGAIGRELSPWTELLPRGTQDALWSERGHAIIKVQREVAVRWSNLVLAGRLGD